MYVLIPVIILIVISLILIKSNKERDSHCKKIKKS